MSMVRFARRCPEVSLADFCRAFIEGSREAEAIRTETQREVTADARFRMRAPAAGNSPTARCRMQSSRRGSRNRCDSSVVPWSFQRRTAGRWTHSGRSIGWPCSPISTTAPRWRRRSRSLASTICSRSSSSRRTSGWRKPHPEIFRETLRRMGIGAHEAIFVGDTPESDVLGPQGVGMDTIWIDRGSAALPPGAAPPTYTVARFAEVATLL